MALRFISAEEAVTYIHNGDHVGFSGFTHAGVPKVIPGAIARHAQKEHEAGRPYQISMFTGASTGDRTDGELARAKAIRFRTPYQTNKDLRSLINSGGTNYVDLHLSTMAQDLRYGFYGNLDVAIVEASDITDDGEIVPTSAVGILPTICRLADRIIVELNECYPASIRGIHDIMELQDPPHRGTINITHVHDRIGKDCVKVDPSKIVGVVKTAAPNDDSKFTPVDDVTRAIGENVAQFFVAEMKAGRIPKTFLPIQSGVGNVANAVLGAMGSNDHIPPFEIYTEVIQDSVLDLMRSGKTTFTSGCSLTVSRGAMEDFYRDLDFFRDKLILRPSEISNNPEVIRRLGVIAINTAIEADIYGNINSTHLYGTRMMNGIGGSGDFTRAAYISIFTTASTAKDGDISSFVPMVSHVDHTEHSVKVIVSEYGIADLRGKAPKQRAEEIINNVVHPDYRDALRDYLKGCNMGQTPMNLNTCHNMHRAFLETGSMKNAHFDPEK